MLLFKEGLHKSEVLVLLCTKDYFTRPWCIMEIWDAACHDVPMCAVEVMGTGFDAETPLGQELYNHLFASAQIFGHFVEHLYACITRRTHI